ncbi:MAG: hypothetical protein N3B21_15320 [Clostridia bacterium]|nr:hypothetical protein [Clostridia bacterium]
MFDKRISIFTGHFGSGKTEVAVNYTVKLAELDYNTVVVDFDIVNPYFRTADVKQQLEEKGIKVVTPLYANTNVDVPALPAEINALFEKRDYRIVFDVGGDDLGARVLSRYHDEILIDDYEMFFVINTKRGMTDTVDKILDMVYSIEYTSRLKVTKLINNTNLLHATTAQDILGGHTLIQSVSEKLNIPIAFISGFPEPIESIEERPDAEIFYMKKMIKLPWE